MMMMQCFSKFTSQIPISYSGPSEANPCLQPSINSDAPQSQGVVANGQAEHSVPYEDRRRSRPVSQATPRRRRTPSPCDEESDLWCEEDSDKVDSDEEDESKR